LYCQPDITPPGLDDACIADPGGDRIREVDGTNPLQLDMPIFWKGLCRVFAVVSGGEVIDMGGSKKNSFIAELSPGMKSGNCR